jgi:hypothetical protein
MRTTVTFDPDVYAQLKRLSANQDFKPFINSTLRLGLAALEAQKNPDRTQMMFKLPSFSGKPIGFDVDNVHQLLSEIEGNS